MSLHTLAKYLVGLMYKNVRLPSKVYRLVYFEKWMKAALW